MDAIRVHSVVAPHLLDDLAEVLHLAPASMDVLILPEPPAILAAESKVMGDEGVDDDEPLSVGDPVEIRVVPDGLVVLMAAVKNHHQGHGLTRGVMIGREMDDVFPVPRPGIVPTSKFLVSNMIRGGAGIPFGIVSIGTT